jgi:hypothetical protein
MQVFAFWSQVKIIQSHSNIVTIIKLLAIETVECKLIDQSVL